jgi:hypothetical protein
MIVFGAAETGSGTLGTGPVRWIISHNAAARWPYRKGSA